MGAALARRGRLSQSKAPITAMAVPISAVLLLGSGTGLMPVSFEKLVTVVVPSRFTSIVAANPLVRSVVSAGTVPAGSKNMLNANVLPEVDVPSGELTADPNKLTSNEIVEPNVK